MKLKTHLFPIASAVMMAAATAGAQSSVYSLNVVGYVTMSFQPGDNWFGNPFASSDVTLNTLMPTAPTGATVSLWNSALNQYSSTATFLGTGWSSNPMLNPGMGALLNTSTLFVDTFVGNVLNFDGSPWSDVPIEPMPFTGPAGHYLFSSKMPVPLSGHAFDPAQNEFSVFESIIGRAPQNGEQVTTLDSLTQLYTTTTFMNGVWNNGDPSLAAGQAAMFNIEAIPEPYAWVLLAVGLGVLGLGRSFRGVATSS
jgi:hypothetical protein